MANWMYECNNRSFGHVYPTFMVTVIPLSTNGISFVKKLNFPLQFLFSDLHVKLQNMFSRKKIMLTSAPKHIITLSIH